MAPILFSPLNFQQIHFMPFLLSHPPFSLLSISFPLLPHSITFLLLHHLLSPSPSLFKQPLTSLFAVMRLLLPLLPVILGLSKFSPAPPLTSHYKLGLAKMLFLSTASNRLFCLLTLLLPSLLFEVVLLSGLHLSSVLPTLLLPGRKFVLGVPLPVPLFIIPRLPLMFCLADLSAIGDPPVDSPSRYP